MQSIEFQVVRQELLEATNFQDDSIICLTNSKENFGTSFHGRPSVIRSPCNFAVEAKYCNERLTNEIVLTHKQYIQMEKENIQLNRQVEDLDRLVNQQEYELACLKYQLEKIKQSQISLMVKLGEKMSNMATMNDLAATQVPQRHIIHKVDRKKEQEMYCVCGVKFLTRQNLREHVKYNTFRANFNCDVCGIWKHGLNQLRIHMRVTHGISSAYLTSLKGCRFCGKLFTSLAQIHEHQRIEHSETRKRETKRG